MESVTLPPVMDCQLCGGEGTFWQSSRSASKRFAIKCSRCGSSSSDSNTFNYWDDENKESQVAEKQAAKTWNRMQSLIAKGLLLEVTEKTTKSKSL